MLGTTAAPQALRKALLGRSGCEVGFVASGVALWPGFPLREMNDAP